MLAFSRMCAMTTFVGVLPSLIIDTSAGVFAGVIVLCFFFDAVFMASISRSLVCPKYTTSSSLSSSSSSLRWLFLRFTPYRPINSDRSLCILATSAAHRNTCSNRSLCVLIAISSIPLLVSLATLSNVFSTALVIRFEISNSSMVSSSSLFPVEVTGGGNPASLRLWRAFLAFVSFSSLFSSVCVPATATLFSAVNTVPVPFVNSGGDIGLIASA